MGEVSTVIGIVGGLVVGSTLIDVLWTTIAAGSGAGPLSGRIGRGLWSWALAVHRRRPSHTLLSALGVTIVLSILMVWIAAVLVGWGLVFTSSDGAVRDATTDAPASLGSRIYFTGYTVFTLGVGDYVPGDGLWQIATVLATGTGLVLVTLSITYLVPVASAVAQRRQLASYIASLGATPSQVVTRGWTGAGFGTLTDHLVGLAPLVHGAHQRHLTFPMLHYFHSADRASAAAPAIVHLADSLHLLRHGVAPEARPDRFVLDTLDSAVESFLTTLPTPHRHIDHDTGDRSNVEDEPLPVPALEELRGHGIPTVSDETYERAREADERRRVRLAALLRNDGWSFGETTSAADSTRRS